MSKVFINIQVRGAPDLVCGSYPTVDAILHLREAIDHLQRLAAPSFDASWGEQPMPLIAPSAEQLQCLNPS